ncbi:MAG: efflux RND transporter periplasmic adaptor subunit, partial [Cyanobacteria bacterium J06648_11]
VARVVPNERRQETVTTKYSGFVDKQFVNETGQFVRRGQPLFSIYSPEVVAGQQEYLLAKKSGDASLRQTSEDRLRFWDLSEKQIQAIAKRDRPKKTIVVHSPFTGYIVMKNFTEGDKVNSGAPLYRIVDLSKIWVLADVYEYELPWLKVGQTASLSLSYAQGQVFNGNITYIYPTVDEKSRTIQIRLEFDNPGLLMRPGMFGTIRIETKPRTGVLRVPASAVIRTGNRNIAFIAEGRGRFRPTELILGEQGDGGMVEVLSGIRSGQRIVTSGHFLLDSESQLNEAITKMAPATSATQPASKATSMPHTQPSTSSRMPHKTPASQPTSRPASPSSQPSSQPASAPSSKPSTESTR